eukprot:TRINITY_DN5415_c1_g1_i5.p1 TRINITY_DN5415_c1_g1~~TRINITY_DN5415_c1_g1_i5.p1  ORF type:complete len:345 (-),score=63.47 TRINITY_DN5415_c1_g1_i5:20-1054(-)
MDNMERGAAPRRSSRLRKVGSGAPAPTPSSSSSSTTTSSTKHQRDNETHHLYSYDDMNDMGGSVRDPLVWSEPELKIFLAGLRQHGPAWKKIAASLKNRTPEMVESLYQLNRNFLNLPTEALNASVFYSILRDQYDRDLNTEEEAIAVAALSPIRPQSPPRTKEKNADTTASEKRQGRSTRRLFASSPTSSSRTKVVTKNKQPPIKGAEISKAQSPAKKQKMALAPTATPPATVARQRGRKPLSETAPVNTTTTTSATTTSMSVQSTSSADSLPPKLREKAYLKGKMADPAPVPVTPVSKPGRKSSKRKRETISETHERGGFFTRTPRPPTRWAFTPLSASGKV